MSTDVVICDTGIANLASLETALERLGVKTVCTLNRDTIASSELLILPGVGSFGAAMERLAQARVVETLQRRLTGDAPSLSICLGMHATPL